MDPHASQETRDPNPVAQARPRPWATRLLLCLLGSWIVLTITMGFLASGNFRVLDPARLRNADEVFREIPAGQERRQDLRYAASELNRYYFRIYSAVHLVIAAAALALHGWSRQRSRWITLGLAACTVTAVLYLVWLTPALVDLGRAIDFMPRDPEPPQVVGFYRLHRLDVALELTKLVVLASITVGLIRQRTDNDSR